MARTDEKSRIIVIGAGASGMMAAGRAAELGARVLVLEKMSRPGIKLLISGKGRSNITNIEEDVPAFIDKFSPSGKFLFNAFNKFFNKDLIEFFKRLGVECVAERGGRVFPQTQRAASILEALKKYMERNFVKLAYGARVSEILVKGQKITGVKTADGRIFEADKVIVAVGGKSYPKTGSSGDGYALAGHLGHHIIEARPSLAPVEVEEAFAKDLQGLTLKNVNLKIFAGGKKRAEEFGDMLFTHFGVSGPVVLTLSGAVYDLLEKGDVEISIDLKPALDEQKLKHRLIREFEGKKIYKSILKELLPASLIPVFAGRSGIGLEKQASQISAKERRDIVALLKDFRLKVRKVRPIEEAIVTRGGVSTKEIDPMTMESKIIKGLYFCGEVIDIDALTGGYNLQAAFSTGWVAGENAALAKITA